MSLSPRSRFLSVALTAGLAIAAPAAGQNPTGPGLSSGSGRGTGLGVDPARDRTANPARPPGDAMGRPPEDIPGPAPDVETGARLLPLARGIADPGERSLALQRIARGMLSERRYVDARDTLREAARAARELPPGLLRDLRIMDVVAAISDLAEEQVGQAKQEVDPMFAAPDEARPTDPEGRAETQEGQVHRRDLIDGAHALWREAAELAGQLANGNFRSETLFLVARAEAAGGEAITLVADGEEGDAERGLRDAADRALRAARSHAERIERVVWQDHALRAIVDSAAASRQYDRGLQIAHGMPRPESRAEALVRLAEAQARRGLDDQATAAYNEAARAVASIPYDDPRAAQAGVLIASLIEAGRYDDARASIVFYPDPTSRLAVLGAVARSQGRRGLADSARVWIDRDVPAPYRSSLHRRVIEGVAVAADARRSGGEASLDPALDRP